jgi:four helix bundle protein
MNNKNDLQNFDAFTVSIELVRTLVPLVKRIGQANPELARQLRKAADSICLNVAEGRRRVGADRLHLWRVAAGSNAEVLACLHVAEAWGILTAQQFDTALDLIDRIGAMLYRLTH